MNKAEFIAELNERLAVLTDEERRDILDEYEQHIDIKTMRGMSEEAATADFGRIEELAADILEAYHVRADYAEMDRKRKGGIRGWFAARSAAGTERGGAEAYTDGTGSRETEDAGGAAGWLDRAYEAVWDGMKRFFCGIRGFCKSAGATVWSGMKKAGNTLKKGVNELAAFCKAPFQKKNPAEDGLQTEDDLYAEDGLQAEDGLHAEGSPQAGDGLHAEGSLQAGDGLHAEGGLHAEDGLYGEGGLRAEEETGRKPGMGHKEGKSSMKTKSGFSAGRAIAGFFGGCLEAVLWCIRWIWNFFCIGAGLIFGFGSCIVIFFMGVLTVLLIRGYPLTGITIAWLGLCMCTVSVTIWCFSMMAKGKGKSGGSGNGGDRSGSEPETDGFFEDAEEEEEMIHA